MICQQGYGPSRRSRIRYVAMKACLDRLADVAVQRAATIHMPRIGCGQAGGSWTVVSELIDETLCSRGIPVTVYELPTEEPHPYTFHHLPSGSRLSGPRLLIGPGATIYVPKILEEISDCSVEADRLSIDPQAMIITDEDRQAERDLTSQIGSTGQGVGAATARRTMQRLKTPPQLAKDIPDLRPFIREAGKILDDTFRSRRRVLVEGTQGTGLSLSHGSYPHVTSRDTTVAGCLAEAGISPSRLRRVIMVCRTYPIRVQSPDGEGLTSGFMSQEISLEEIARRSGLDLEQLRGTEKTSTTGRKRRIAEFDWALLRKAVSLNDPTDIALTFADYVSGKNRDARRFEQLTEETIRFIQEVERVAAAPVSLISTRFHSRSIIDRRSW